MVTPQLGALCPTCRKIATDQLDEALELFWILAVVLVVAGIFRIVKGDTLLGIVFIVVGLLVGPGGTSVFS
ncbi:unannotated protein [freshwater metagenome]|uniref:Unannotated protein n=1 Tax=freshwater metagenome TaxID=449393 RepID=A0A6J6DP29_9ZZZZ